MGGASRQVGGMGEPSVFLQTMFPLPPSLLLFTQKKPVGAACVKRPFSQQTGNCRGPTTSCQCRDPSNQTTQELQQEAVLDLTAASSTESGITWPRCPPVRSESAPCAPSHGRTHVASHCEKVVGRALQGVRSGRKQGCRLAPHLQQHDVLFFQACGFLSFSPFSQFLHFLGIHTSTILSQDSPSAVFVVPTQ